MKSSSFFATVLLPALSATSFAQEGSSARQGTAAASSARSTATSSLDLEGERATCFKDCYRKYAALASCPYGASSFDACWCSDDDWTEREEDCVWEICGVDAYNNYANIRPRVCETVSIPSNRASNTGSPGTSTRSSLIFSASRSDRSTQTKSSEPTSESQSRQTSTFASSSQTQSVESTTRPNAATSTTTGAAARATQTPNEAARVAWSCSKSTGMIVLLTYLYTVL